MGLRFPVPRKRTTRFFLRSFGPSTCRSFSVKPPVRNRWAMASAAVVTLPTESVVLISMSCLKMSRASRLVGSRLCACASGKLPIQPNTTTQRIALRICSPQMLSWEGNGPAAGPSNSLQTF